ncbi:MAG: phospho-N-acetylmuramoyl-pentapeptide-transferase [Microscillaceae bacterium]|jgi:phospho-N-acetylmuramoyl-pentapeptide-transferase|nr:phospho-N-acetylmuramoyl-pentapeptide-transferase [Microscillaceae bacterium]
MLYYLFTYLDQQFDIIGTGVFQYISFRAGMAAAISMAVGMIFGKRLINRLRQFQMSEDVRKLGLAGEEQKQGTPTMGGLIIIGAILLPTLLLAKLDNIYIILLLISTLWLGAIGFLDDYTKVFKKKNFMVGDRGIKGKYKIFGQVGLGLIVGLTLYFHEDVVVRQYQKPDNQVITSNRTPSYHDIKSTATTIPFVKNNELDYSILGNWGSFDLTWLLYALIVIFIITAVSNGANITDGLDGLAAGTSATIGLTLGLFAYLSGNAVFSNYLNIMFIPNAGELVIFCSAFTGACIGFLWYNSYPAQVFMGDTGSLTLGGLIAVLAFCVRKELLIPIMCGIFLAENLSVMLQVGYFKYTKRRFGEGRRIFKMAPLHHHYQKLGYHEAKIVTRFWTIGIILAIITLVTLKLR